MKKIYFLITLISFQLLISNQSSAQVGEWVWLHGSQTPSSFGTFGIQGIPSPTNVPPAVYEACEWTDLNGNFWLFGGYNVGHYGALWKYDPTTNMWTWMKGPTTTNQVGVYGTQGVPSPANYPPCKSYTPTSWTDLKGNLWMFGGLNSANGGFSDLWEYDISTNMWTWMKGPMAVNQPGVYGTQSVPDTANNPTSRWECATSWTDNNGDLWLFGGFCNINGYGNLNDLWRYNIPTNTWTWMKGSSAKDQPATYGTLGLEAGLNVPGARYAYSRWKDINGNFWIFGGGNYNSNNNFNDLWRYNLANNKWTWMGGSSLPNAGGLYGTQCVASPSNIPGKRYENRAAWTDQSGNFWMLGGGIGGTFSNVWNDLWMYCFKINQWVWVNGDTIVNPPGNWGIIGVSSPTNKINGRAGANAWNDKNGHLYFFGGSTSPFNTPYNDLWKFTIDPACGACSQALPVANFISSDTVFCNEGGKCIDFIDHSSGNPTSWKWFFPGAQPDSSNLQNPTNICYYNPGTYAVTLIISNPAGTDTMVVSPMITFGTGAVAPTITLIGGDTLVCSHASSYQWYFNGGPIPGATDSFYVAINDGTYNVYITDSIGCSRLGFGIAFTLVNELTQHTIGIYPNPSGGNFEISFASGRSGNAKIQLFDLLGASVYYDEQKIGTGNNAFHLNVRNLSSGIYVLRILLDGEMMNHKIVIEK